MGVGLFTGTPALKLGATARAGYRPQNVENVTMSVATSMIGSMTLRRGAQDIDRHVGARMRERRIMLGLTQQQMAELIGVTYQQAHKYEKGINRIAAGRLSTIAQALGVEVSYFFENAEADQASVEPSPQQRLLLELARSFVALPSRKHQEAICNLARVLANHDLGDDLDMAIEDQATAA